MGPPVPPPPEPPVVIEPAPVKLRLNPLAPTLALPVRLGKLPVAPA